MPPFRWLLFPISSNRGFYMHHPTDVIVRTVIPVVEHWLVRDIAQWNQWRNWVFIIIIAVFFFGGGFICLFLFWFVVVFVCVFFFFFFFFFFLGGGGKGGPRYLSGGRGGGEAGGRYRNYLFPSHLLCTIKIQMGGHGVNGGHAPRHP